MVVSLGKMIDLVFLTPSNAGVGGLLFVMGVEVANGVRRLLIVVFSIWFLFRETDSFAGSFSDRRFSPTLVSRTMTY